MNHASTSPHTIYPFCVRPLYRHRLICITSKYSSVAGVDSKSSSSPAGFAKLTDEGTRRKIGFHKVGKSGPVERYLFATARRFTKMSRSTVPDPPRSSEVRPAGQGRECGMVARMMSSYGEQRLPLHPSLSNIMRVGEAMKKRDAGSHIQRPRCQDPGAIRPKFDPRSLCVVTLH